MVEKIGDGLVRIGAMTADQVRSVLKKQNSGDTGMFGEIAIAEGYINDQAIQDYLKQKL